MPHEQTCIIQILFIAFARLQIPRFEITVVGIPHIANGNGDLRKRPCGSFCVLGWSGQGWGGCMVGPQWHSVDPTATQQCCHRTRRSHGGSQHTYCKVEIRLNVDVVVPPNVNGPASLVHMSLWLPVFGIIKICLGFLPNVPLPPPPRDVGYGCPTLMEREACKGSKAPALLS